MAVEAGSLRSHVATISAMSRARAEPGMLKWGLMAVAAGLSFIPVVGVPISYLPSRMMNALDAKAEQTSLANHYRVQIAQRMGIAPEEVTRQHLLELAAKDEAFAKLIAGSVADKAKANRSAAIGTAVGTGASIFVPGAGMLGVIGANIAADMGASLIFDKDEATVSAAADYFDEVRAAGQQVQPQDIMLLRVAQNEELSAEIEKNFGGKFHKLSAMKRLEVAQSMPVLFQACVRDAMRLNEGSVTSQQLAVEKPPAMNWQAAVGKRAKPATSFRAQVESRRAAQAIPNTARV